MSFILFVLTIYDAPQLSNSASWSKKSHPSSKSALTALALSSLSPLPSDGLWTEDVGLVFFGVSDDSPCSGTALVRDEPEEAKLRPGTKSDAMLFKDNPEVVAKMQLVWLEETDSLNGTRSSNFSFNSLTSWQITEISPLHKEKKLHK